MDNIATLGDAAGEIHPRRQALRATELFADAPELAPDTDLHGEMDPNMAEALQNPVAGLRILELEDCDVAPPAIDAMESGDIQTLKSLSAEEIESQLVVNEEGYSVRVALVDASSGQAAKAIDFAILTEVDLIVVGPMGGAGAGELNARLEEAARTGHGVFALSN